MLVTCTKTGLTYARKVHREGDVFILTGALEREYKNLSVEAWTRKQKKTYSGEVVFRPSTSEELIEAIKSKQIDPGSATVRGHLSKQQLRIAYDYVESKAAKRVAAIQALRDGLDEEIEEIEVPEKKVKKKEEPEEEKVEEPEEEKVEEPEEEKVEEPEEEKVEAPAEKVEEPEEEKVEAPAEKVEEPVEDLELAEELSEEKDVEVPAKEPVEEPVEEGSGKETKKKDKKKKDKN